MVTKVRYTAARAAKTNFPPFSYDIIALLTEQRKKQPVSDSSTVGRRRRTRRTTTAGFLPGGKLNADCRGLDLGEVSCREKESCLSRGSRGTALMIRHRSNQVNCGECS